MAVRANWKGYLKLSLVSCAVALYPAASSSSRIRFNTLNRETGNRVKRQFVDASTGDVVEDDEQVKGYQVGKGSYVVVEDEELEAIQLESTHTIDVESFVPRDEVDLRYLDTPYYIAPDDKVAQEAFAVIRDAMTEKEMAGLARVVMARREHMILLEPLGKGLLGTTLRLPYEVRDGEAVFRGYSGREAARRNARAGDPHRREEEGSFRPDEVRGPLRERGHCARQVEADRQADPDAEGAAALERHQPDGRVEAQHRHRARR